MKIRNLSIQFLTLTLLAMPLAACDKGNEEAAATAEPETKPDAEPEAAPVDPAVQAEADALLNPDLDGLDPKVAQAVRIAREIEADPQAADSVLEKHQLDREGLDALMYDIARSPELSKAYREARMSI